MIKGIKRAKATANIIAVLAATGVVVQAAVTAHWTAFAVSLVVLVTIHFGYRFQLLGLLCALATGTWPALVVAAFALLAEVGWELTLRFAPVEPVFDESALAALVSSVPEAVVAPVAGTVDTLALLKAAIDDDPGRWGPPGRVLSAEASGEGGLVSGTRWTVVAAEAILVARRHPDTLAEPDIHTLAAAALLLPNSRANAAMAGHGAGQTLGLRVLGLTPAAMVTVLKDAARQPGGGLIIPRVDLDLRGRVPRSSVLGDAGWAAITGRTGNGTR